TSFGFRVRSLVARHLVPAARASRSSCRARRSAPTCRPSCGRSDVIENHGRRAPSRVTGAAEGEPTMGGPPRRPGTAARSRLLLVAAVLAGAALVAAHAARAAVLCAKPRNDGTFNSGVKIREACKPNEVQLDPAAVGFCCGQTTTTLTVT